MSEQALTHWRLETDGDGIAWLHLDKADGGANVLCRPVVEELDTVLSQLETQPPRGLVILSDKSAGFIAGADIKEFTTLADEADGLRLVRRAQTVLDRLEEAPYPTLALIHGYCLGGGLELALACRYRIADEDRDTKLGLPEVRLGIHPGFGGTVRLPRLIGGPAALDLILSGRSVNARQAAKLGIVDYSVPTRQFLVAARKVILEAPEPHRPTRWQALSNHRLVRPLVGRMVRKKLAEKARPDHYPAPYAALDLWLRYADDPKQMMVEEAASVARLVTGDTARNLIRVFFLQERLKGLGRKSDIDVKHVHVVGGGVMGGDIAAWSALQGYRVTLQDRQHKHLASVYKRASELYNKELKLPRLVQAALDRLIPDLGGLGVPEADVVVEAIYENVEAKRELFRRLEPQLKPGALLATNTSSIPLEVLGEALANFARLIGLHFFNPVAKMQLVEIVHGPGTDPNEIKRGAAFARHINRLPLPVKSSPGFLVNRVLMPYLLEAVLLESEGVPPVLIDRAAIEFGMPMGPIELADTVGLDICLSVAEILSKALGGTVPERLRGLVAAGHLGRKTGRGFYLYEKGKPQKAQPPTGYSAPDDLTDRLMLRLLNETVACLREQVVEDADLLDAGVIFGTGFAPFRGGPMHYIEQSGREGLRARLLELERRHGERFRPDAGWEAAATPTG